MPYQEEISRSKPSAFLFLIDQSGSMGAPFGRPDKSGKTLAKAEVVADALNATLEEVINRSSREEGIRDFFEVGLIGYGASSTAEFCWEGSLAGQQMIPLSEVKKFANVQSIEEENVVRGKIVKETLEHRVWLSPCAVGQTPMRGALELARNVLEDWIERHQDSYPPIVINITDGAATDVKSNAELLNAAQDIRNLSNRNRSNVILVNCHISERSEVGVVFPSRAEELPEDPYAQALFQMSSVLPSQMTGVAAKVLERALGPDNNLRGMVFNGNAVTLVKFLEIGTRPAIENVDAAPDK
jgi:hypothetical protein